MKYYPIFLDLGQRTCAVIGAGKVGLRKIQSLVQCSPARIIVIDPFVDFINLPDPEKVIWHLKQHFSPEMLKGCDLAFACTSDPEINDMVVKACKGLKILCNVAERPELGDFILPGIFSRQDLIIAVSTCGSSPALSAKIKNDLRELFGPEYGLLTELLAGVRKILLPLNLSQEKNRLYFKKIVDSNAVSLLESGDRQKLFQLMIDILPQGTHYQVQRLIDAIL